MATSGGHGVRRRTEELSTPRALPEIRILFDEKPKREEWARLLISPFYWVGTEALVDIMKPHSGS